MSSADSQQVAERHSDSEGRQIVQVAVPLPIRQQGPLCYDYGVPNGQTLSRGMVVEVPLGKRQVWGIVMADHASGEVNLAILKEITSIADLPALLPRHLRFLEQVSEWTLAPFGMVMRMLLSCPKAHLPPPLQTVYTLNEKSEAGAKLTPKRARIISFLQQGFAMGAAALAKETGTSEQIVKTMAKQGLLDSHQIAKTETLFAPPPSFGLVELTPDQKAVAQAMASFAGKGFSAHLLDGVTGSGKTEVYFDLVAEQIRQQKQVLILLPEIALTAAWQDRFEARFGIKPLIWHSSVVESKRRALWRACLTGEPVVVVGARSALFLPFSDLGLMVIDEEHEQAFKQEDLVVYQARDMGVMRAYHEQIPVILATATPSLESWVNAGKAGLKARYHHWRLEARVGKAVMPDIQMIDLKQDRPPAGRWLSERLVTEIQTTLENGQQSLLFLNRRGYAPLSICEACGTKAKCHECESWLVTHKLSGARQCHHCGYRQPLRDECESCGTKGQMRAYGPGVERLAEEVSVLFPEARFCVFSSDTAARPEVAAEMIRAISDGEVDIIIGTQMAAKGHHFPLLTLVGVVDADFGLQGGDLRAAERTYQMLSQASGRAGRAQNAGKALLQSYEPDNAVFLALQSGDRDQFLTIETEMRHKAGMPPFGRLAAVILSGPDEGQVEQAALTIGATRPAYQNVMIYGPTPAPIARIRGRYRMRFLVSMPKTADMQQILRDWLFSARLPSQIYLQIDVDPYSFL